MTDPHRAEIVKRIRERALEARAALSSDPETELPEGEPEVLQTVRPRDYRTGGMPL